MMKRALALLVLAFAAALPAAEWTLAGFPTHWDQSGTYNAYTPGRRKCGCIAVAGAAVLQFHNVTKDPGTQTVECSIDSEPIWLTTRPGAYDWDNADDALYGRVAYNLGVQVGMNYGGQESSAATERLAGVLESYGITCTYARRMATGGFTQAELEAHLYVPLRLGWPVILGIRGGGTSHAVVATGVRPAAGSEAVETRLFAGFGGKGDGWYALPEATINDIPFDTVTDILIVRTQAEGDRCW